jgi:hypothetical protein
MVPKCQCLLACDRCTSLGNGPCIELHLIRGISEQTHNNMRRFPLTVYHLQQLVGSVTFSELYLLSTNIKMSLIFIRIKPVHS